MLDHHHLLDELERRVEAARLAVSERRQECARLRARLYELEATRLELLEENRELDEQNSELEAHNRHLLEKLAAGESHGGFPPPTRRAQGLAALIGHRPRQNVSAPTPQNAPTSSSAQGEQTPGVSPAAPRRAPAVDEKPKPKAEEPRAEEPKAEKKVEQKTTVEAVVVDEAPPSPQALLAQWYQRYPAAFFKGHTRPLKVGIHHDLTAREPWPEKLVRRALAGYVNLPRYLKAVREGGERIDLDGQPAGTVDAQAADHARQKLERLQAGRAEHSRQDRFRGDPARQGKAGKGAGNDRRPPREAQQHREPARDKPAAKQAPEPHATLEDKLSALLAKHNRQG
ncbi:ProQ/FINO family protein [Halomonas korlensis]|uniref:SRNA-binding protein n=1 Tax=Halomonas korlensis TaxID=463301 RepID=A0A1I7HWZ3_9GAMM|nr:ProQ/FINO family protein [Halomonas korlensis]SFU65167.1 sRNA-binding protein [Halomonas korlensis]